MEGAINSRPSFSTLLVENEKRLRSDSKMKIYWSYPKWYRESIYHQLDNPIIQQSRQNQDYFNLDNIALEFKEKGTLFFQEKKYKLAALEFEKALGIFNWIENSEAGWTETGVIDDFYLREKVFTPKSESEDSSLKQLKVSLFLNLTACYQKMELWADSIQACDHLISLDPLSHKAYYRRAQARLLQGNPLGLPSVEYTAHTSQTDSGSTTITSTAHFAYPPIPTPYSYTSTALSQPPTNPSPVLVLGIPIREANLALHDLRKAHSLQTSDEGVAQRYLQVRDALRQAKGKSVLMGPGGGNEDGEIPLNMPKPTEGAITKGKKKGKKPTLSSSSLSSNSPSSLPSSSSSFTPTNPLSPSHPLTSPPVPQPMETDAHPLQPLPTDKPLADRYPDLESSALVPVVGRGARSNKPNPVPQAGGIVEGSDAIKDAPVVTFEDSVEISDAQGRKMKVRLTVSTGNNLQNGIPPSTGSSNRADTIYQLMPDDSLRLKAAAPESSTVLCTQPPDLVIPPSITISTSSASSPTTPTTPTTTALTAQTSNNRKETKKKNSPLVSESSSPPTRGPLDPSATLREALQRISEIEAAAAQLRTHGSFREAQLLISKANVIRVEVDRYLEANRKKQEQEMALKKKESLWRDLVSGSQATESTSSSLSPWGGFSVEVAEEARNRGLDLQDPKVQKLVLDLKNEVAHLLYQEKMAIPTPEPPALSSIGDPLKDQTGSKGKPSSSHLKKNKAKKSQSKFLPTSNALPPPPSTISTNSGSSGTTTNFSLNHPACPFSFPPRRIPVPLSFDAAPLVGALSSSEFTELLAKAMKMVRRSMARGMAVKVLKGISPSAYRGMLLARKCGIFILPSAPSTHPPPSTPPGGVAGCISGLSVAGGREAVLQEASSLSDMELSHRILWVQRASDKPIYSCLMEFLTEDLVLLDEQESTMNNANTFNNNNNVDPNLAKGAVEAIEPSGTGVRAGGEASPMGGEGKVAATSAQLQSPVSISSLLVGVATLGWTGIKGFVVNLGNELAGVNVESGEKGTGGAWGVGSLTGRPNSPEDLHGDRIYDLLIQKYGDTIELSEFLASKSPSDFQLPPKPPSGVDYDEWGEEMLQEGEARVDESEERNSDGTSVNSLPRQPTNGTNNPSGDPQEQEDIWKEGQALVSRFTIFMITAMMLAIVAIFLQSIIPGQWQTEGGNEAWVGGAGYARGGVRPPHGFPRRSVMDRGGVRN